MVLRVRHQDCLFSILDHLIQRRHRTDAESQQENFLHHSQCLTERTQVIIRSVIPHIVILLVCVVR